MPKGALTSVQDCEDFVRGCVLYGVGGGGSGERGLGLLTNELAKGRRPEWLDVDSIADDDWVACAWGMGSVAPDTPDKERQKKALGLGDKVVPDNLAAALKELQEYTGKRLAGVVALEPGGTNMPNPMAAAAQLGISLVDADISGRAVPEITQTLPHMQGIPLAPFALADWWGDVVVIKRVLSEPMAERLGKHLAVAAFGHTAMAGLLMTGRQLRQAVVRDTVSRSLRVGRAIRLARESGQEPIERALSETAGRLLFTGTIAKREWEDRDGYMYGSTEITGSESFAGHFFRIWFKNENHVTWRDGEPYVTSPDLIAVLDRRTGEPLTNTVLAEGQTVAVVGIAAVPEFQTPEGLALLGPRHFGFDLDYRPLSELESL